MALFFLIWELFLNELQFRPQIQSNLDGSNTDGLFTRANLNSFLSPYEIHPIAQENKYLRKFSYFIVKLMLCVLIRIVMRF